MGNRIVPIVLITLLVIVNAQLWFGRGGLPNVTKLEQTLQQQKASNEEARRTNEQLTAEVNDLKEGLNMVEERARQELGMVKANEIFVQIAK
jgi:cell division protein FtsB